MIILQEPMSIIMQGTELDYWQIEKVYQIVSSLTPSPTLHADIITELNTYALLYTVKTITPDVYPTINIDLPFFKRVVRY